MMLLIERLVAGLILIFSNFSLQTVDMIFVLLPFLEGVIEKITFFSWFL